MKWLSDWSAYENYYHFVAFTKYRKNLFFDGEIRHRLLIIFGEIVQRKDGVELVECAVAYNHIHVLIRTELPMSNVVQSLLGRHRDC